MTVYSQPEFLWTINDAFGSVFQDYGFKVSQATEDLIIAGKEDIELLFRLEYSYHMCYLSVEIRLSGQLGEEATSIANRRHIGVTAIAKCLDPNYGRSLAGATNLGELRQTAEVDKEDMLRYCRKFLSGDVSSWQQVVDCLQAKAQSGALERANPNRRDVSG